MFWVLFSAKSSGQGSEDALLYTQVRLFYIILLYTNDRATLSSKTSGDNKTGVVTQRKAARHSPNRSLRHESTDCETDSLAKFQTACLLVPVRTERNHHT